MDYVYICRKRNNEELRYSLRSLKENAPEGNVWLVGGKPDWYVGDYLYVPDTHTKYANINNCFEAIANSPDISDDFVLMNDDFFILSKIDSIPTVHSGYLKDRIDERYRIDPVGEYTRSLMRTHSQLQKAGIENPIDYDLHMPMIINKTKLKEIVPTRCQVRSMYGNIFGIEAEMVSDAKIYGPGKMSDKSYDISSNTSPIVSTEDSSFDYLYKTILKDTFLNSTIHE